ncbi:hypothetical protein L1887_61869 [Cichorium endivia]|nr:hypothetical protein L1887_61869 [Cichorium endivia]
MLELMGHSGIRCAGTSPAFDCLPLAKLDMDIVIEDHDLHHSNGWKKSGNYGKQTRIFDKLFGTVMPRVEMLDHLIDSSDKGNVKLAGQGVSRVGDSGSGAGQNFWGQAGLGVGKGRSSDLGRINAQARLGSGRRIACLLALAMEQSVSLESLAAAGAPPALRLRVDQILAGGRVERRGESGTARVALRFVELEEKLDLPAAFAVKPFERAQTSSNSSSVHKNMLPMLSQRAPTCDFRDRRARLARRVVLWVARDTAADKRDLMRLSNRVPQTRRVEVDPADTVAVLPKGRHNGAVGVEAHRIEAKLFLEQRPSRVKVLLDCIAISLADGQFEVCKDGYVKVLVTGGFELLVRFEFRTLTFERRHQGTLSPATHRMRVEEALAGGRKRRRARDGEHPGQTGHAAAGHEISMLL